MSTRDYESLKIALAIKGARTLLGMSLKDVADYCNVSAVTVGKWEANQLPLKVVMFIKLTKLFNQNGVFIDLENEKLTLSITKEGLAKQLDFLEHKAKLKSNPDEAIQFSEGDFVVSPVITRRKRRKEVEPD